MERQSSAVNSDNDVTSENAPANPVEVADCNSTETPQEDPAIADTQSSKSTTNVENGSNNTNNSNNTASSGSEVEVQTAMEVSNEPNPAVISEVEATVSQTGDVAEDPAKPNANETEPVSTQETESEHAATTEVDEKVKVDSTEPASTVISDPDSTDEVEELMKDKDLANRLQELLTPVEVAPEHNTVSFSVDCGRSGEAPHLSLQKAKDNAHMTRPVYYDKETGKYREYPYDTDLGRMKIPFEEYLPSIFTKSEHGSVVLDQYGVGVSFYFRLLKALSIIFVILTIITLPSLIIYASSSSIPPVQETYIGTVNSQNMLATATIASLSEPIPSCREAMDTEVFEFLCPGEYKITSIVSYYGQNYGSCACPGPYQPDSAGFCYGYPLDSSYPGACSVDPVTQKTLSCFNTNTRYGNKCCAFEVDMDNQPNLNALELKPNLNCNSFAAPYIANAMCQGKSRCRFSVSPNETYVFPVSSLPDFAPPDHLVCRNVYTNSAGVQMCSTDFSYNSNFANCTELDANGNTTFSATATKGFIFEAICQNDKVIIGESSYDPNYIVTVASTLDAIAIIVFIFGISWVRHVEEVETEEANRATCTASDYTIVCYTLPKFKDGEVKSPEVMGKRLKEHFESTISKYAPHASEPIRILDINFSTAHCEYLQSACDRGAAATEVDFTIAKINSKIFRKRFKKTNNEGKSMMRQLKKAMLNFEYANDNCKKLSDRASREMHSAYITFENETSFVECLKLYPNVGWLTTFFQEKDLHIDEQVVMIERAPNPTEVVWEHLSTPWWSRTLRVILTTFLTILILGLSYAMIFEAKYQSSRFGKRNDQQACSTFDVLVSKDPVLMANTSVNVITYQDVLWDENPRYYNLTDTFGSLGYLMCYCQQVLYDADGDINQMNNYMFFNEQLQMDEPFCNQMLSGSLTYTAATYVATFIIIMINTNLTKTLRSFASFEMHASKTTEILSLAVKLFIAQYINTAILSLIISGDLKKTGAPNISFGSSGIIEFGIFTGSITDYNSQWYFTVGSSITFTMFMFILGTIPSITIDVISNKIARFWDRRWFMKKSITHKDLQAELDDLYAGPEPQMELKYAALLTLVFVDLMYSAAMPILYLITAINLGIIFGLEKLIFLRLTRAPPVLSESLPKMITTAFYWAALIHAANGLWMFGNDFFYSPNLDDTHTNIPTPLTPAGEFVQISHDWNPQIVWKERAFGSHSLFLFIIVAFVAFALLIRLFNDVVLEYMGLKTVSNHINIYLMERFPFFHRYGIKLPIIEPEPEGNPPYLEAIPLHVLKFRVASGLLSHDIHMRYLERIKEIEGVTVAVEDKTEGDKSDDKDEKARTSATANSDGTPSSISAVTKVFNFVNTLKHKVTQEVSESSEKDVGIEIASIDKSGNSTYAKVSADEEDPDVEAPRASLHSSDKDDAVLRMLSGHESYNIATSPEYSKKFGLGTEHIMRVKPDDWVVATSHLPTLKPDSEIISNLLRECAPNRNDDGEIPYWDVIFNKLF